MTTATNGRTAGLEMRQCALCQRWYQPRTKTQVYCDGPDCRKVAHREETRRWQARKEAGLVHPQAPLSEQGTRMRCLVCERTYDHCACVCPSCGKPRWSPDPRWAGEWQHHIYSACGRKS
jgi:hypothetical protein